MTLTSIWRWRKSLAAQLGLLSALFVLLALSQLIFGSLWAFSKNMDRVDLTRYRVMDELSLAIDDGRLDQVAQSDFIQKVAVRNPHLRYYVQSDRMRTAFGGEPHLGDEPWLLSLLEGATYTIVEDGEIDSDPCGSGSYGYLPFRENGTVGHAYVLNCSGDVRYIEVAGIETAAISRVDLFWEFARDLSFAQAADYLILSAGLLLIALFTVYRASRSLRKVATLTGFIAFDERGARLPESGLPLEIQPLVHALNDMLQRIDDAVERQRFFVATAAHELRTPLTILRTRLEEFPDSEPKESIKSDLKRMSRLVEQLLSLTWLKSEGRIKLGETDLVRVARDVCAARAPLAINLGVEIELKADSDSVLVEGDAQMMTMAVTNLLDNAISFSEKGGLVTIKVTNEGCVSIRDRGPGIPAGHETSVFEPFSKNPPNRNGYGLGLAITAAVMALHHGRAEAQNAPDDGAVFSLWFNATAPQVIVHG